MWWAGMHAVTLVCNCLHTLDVLIIAAFHFVIVSKPTNIITQESPCKVGALSTVKAHLLSLIYRTHQWLKGAWWPSIETVQWPTWRAGEPTSTTALLHPPPPHPVLHIPSYPCTILVLCLCISSYFTCTIFVLCLCVSSYYTCTIFVLCLYRSSFHTCTILAHIPGYVLAPTFNWIMQPLVHIHPKFAPIYLHFRPCLMLICMLYACYADFRALYSGWFTPR